MAKMENLFARRFLRARKSNTLLSYLSVTSVIGVMLGVAALIVVVSVMDGFTENLKKTFLGANPHIIVTHVNASPISDWEGRLTDIAGMSHITSATPIVMGQAMISNDRTLTGVIVRGIDPVLEKDLELRKTIVSGSLDDLVSSENGQMPTVLIGKELRLSLGLMPGQEVTLISPTVTRSAFGIVPKMRTFKVAGYFDTGMYQHNSTLIYLHMNEAQSFYLMGGNVSALTITLDNPDRAETIASEVQIKLNEKIPLNAPQSSLFWARDWLSMNTNVFEALKLEQFALFVILTLIVVVASFTIVSMITVTVKDKIKEIAIIRAMGGSEKLISGIFLRQGIIIGTIGTVLGNILALVISFVLKNFKIVEIPSEIYFSDTIPIRLTASVFVIVTVCSLAITYLASVFPARMSAKMSPLDAIRND